MTPEASTWLLTQGVLGFAVFMLILLAIFQYREKNAETLKWEKKFQDEQSKHALELAEERKAHALTQTTRITEMQQGWVTANKVEDTLAQFVKFLQRTPV